MGTVSMSLDLAFGLGADVGTVGGDRTAVDLECGERHRAVDVHGDVGDGSRPHPSAQLHEQHLGAVHREGRDEHHAAVMKSGLDGVRQGLVMIDCGMAAVAVGRLDDHRAHSRRRVRTDEQRVDPATEITGEAGAAPVDIDVGVTWGGTGSPSPSPHRRGTRACRRSHVRSMS